MTRLAHLFRRFLRHSGAATAVEYGLLVALLSVVVITGVNAAGVSLYTVMNTLSGKIAAAH